MNIVGNDGIPIAMPVNERPFWRKVAVVSAGILLVLAVVLVITLSGGDAPPELPIHNKAKMLRDEAYGLIRPVPHIFGGAEPGQLLDWEERVQEASSKFGEILELKAEDPEEVRLLTAVQEEAARDKKSVSKRITDIRDELWPMVKANEQPGDMHSRVSSAIPIIRDGSGHGSGFLFEYWGKLWVATNRHVVEGVGRDGLKLVFLIDNSNNRIRYSDPVPVPWKASVGAIHRRADLAIIDIPVPSWLQDSISSKKIRPMKLLPKKLQSQPMDPIWTIGHPGGQFSGTATTGEITAIRKQYYGAEHHYGKLIQINAKVDKGSSGCPVFDRHGRVVGVVAFGNTERTVNYAIDVDALWELITDPEVRLSIEEVERLAKVSTAYTRYRMEMEKEGWRLCESVEADRQSRWVDALEKWVNYRMWVFEGMAKTQYAVMAVSDPKQHVQFIGLPSNARRIPGSDRLMVRFELDADAGGTVSIGVAYPDSSDSKKDWPIHVGIFRHTSPTTAPQRD